MCGFKRMLKIWALEDKDRLMGLRSGIDYLGSKYVESSLCSIIEILMQIVPAP